jgi:hypothetical protein
LSAQQRFLSYRTIAELSRQPRDRAAAENNSAAHFFAREAIDRFTLATLQFR